MSKIEVDAIDKQSGSTLTLGGSGTTVQLGTGASQTGFGREGSVNWQTGSLKTSTFTAVSGEGYFINSGSSITVNLPAGSAGAIVAVSDYARNFSTYNLTISANGSEKIGGVAADAKLNVDGQAATFVYVDSTKGWINVQNAEDTEQGQGFIQATGGTISTVCTNFKVHTFTGPGTFCVSAGAGPVAVVDYLVVAGGGGGGSDGYAGAGGAGGYRESPGTASGCYSVSPLGVSPAAAIPVSAGPYAVAVGGGGTAGSCTDGVNGSVSSFSTISSAGGGGGGAEGRAGLAGGSGGGGSYGDPGGAGNTPPVTPPQGNTGGAGVTPAAPQYTNGGGGGAGAVGGAAGSSSGNGGTGATSSINGTPTTRAGGGGGGTGDTDSRGTGGSGGGGNGGTTPNGAGSAGSTNTGGGGGGGGRNDGAGGAGGSGIVILRYRFQ